MTHHKLPSLLPQEKGKMWAVEQTQAAERLVELAEFFSGEKALARVGRDSKVTAT